MILYWRKARKKLLKKKDRKDGKIRRGKRIDIKHRKKNEENMMMYVRKLGNKEKKSRQKQTSVCYWRTKKSLKRFGVGKEVISSSPQKKENEKKGGEYDRERAV